MFEYFSLDRILCFLLLNLMPFWSMGILRVSSWSVGCMNLNWPDQEPKKVGLLLAN